MECERQIVQTLHSWAAVALLLLAQFTVPLAHRGSDSSGIPEGPPPGGNAPTFTHVQSCGNQVSGEADSITATCSSAIGAGDLLYICLNNYGGLGSPVWSGDSGRFVKDITDYSWDNTGNTNQFSCVYVLSAGGGSTTITATIGLFWGAITVDEWSVSGGSAVKDVSDSGGSGLGSPFSSNSITTTVNGDLVIGFFVAANSVSAGTGWSTGATSAFPSMQEYQIQTAAGAIAASANGDGATHIIAFK